MENCSVACNSGLDWSGADNHKIFFFVVKMLAGGEAEGNWLLPDVLVNVSRGGDEVTDGVVKEVLPVPCLTGCEHCSANVFVCSAVLTWLKI